MTLAGQNCSRFEAARFGFSSDSGGLAQKGYYRKVDAQILQPKCVACHSTASPDGGIDLSTYAKIIATGSVIVNNSAGSSLVTSVQNGSMPQGAPHLDPAEIQLIASWIDNGAKENEPPKANAGIDRAVIDTQAAMGITLQGSGTDVDGTIASYAWLQVSGPGTAAFSSMAVAAPQVTGLTAGAYVFRLTVTDDGGLTASDDVNVSVSAAVHLTDLNTNIFMPKCASCHGNTLASGNYNMATYAGIVKDVVPGNCPGSKLCQRVNDNTMPPGAPLSQAEKDAIKAWINQGALNN
jgi:uncharacterized membrane protein